MSADEVEDDRARRRDVTCVTTGLLAGAVLGALASLFDVPGGLLLPAIGAVIGGVLSGIVALHIDVEDWDPPVSRRSYVGARSPDDDLGSSS